MKKLPADLLIKLLGRTLRRYDDGFGVYITEPRNPLVYEPRVFEVSARFIIENDGRDLRSEILSLQNEGNGVMLRMGDRDYEVKDVQESLNPETGERFVDVTCFVLG